MNNPNLYFDGAIGGFIRKADYQLVSTDADLEAQHEIIHKVLTMGSPTTTCLILYISHASSLNYSFDTDIEYEVAIAPINSGGIPIWKTVTHGTTVPYYPGSAVDTYSIQMPEFTLTEHPGIYWMEIRFRQSSGPLTLPLILRIV